SLPAVGAIFAPNPATFEVPVRQFALEARFDLGIRIGAFLASLGHGPPSIVSRVCSRVEIANPAGVAHCKPVFVFEKPHISEKQGAQLPRGAPPPMPDKTESITVTIAARLHLGFLDLNGSLGRRFGSIGLAITGLRTRVAFRRAPKNRVTG